MARLIFCFAFISLAVYVNHSLACNGYKLRFNSVENCGGDDQIVSIDKNFTVQMSPNCEVTSIGCITSKGFNQAKIKYNILKSGVSFASGNPDACAVLDKKSEEHKAKLQMFGFPTECPIPEGRRCMTGDKKIDVNKYKSFLAMAVGKLQIVADIEHDTGKSCLKIGFEVYK